MKENYHKWYSQSIGEDFEMLVFGESGIPLILFPPAESRYYDYKDFGVIESLRNYIDEQIIKVYCPDSYAMKSWQKFDIAPEERVKRNSAFEKTIFQDILGFANYETEENAYILSGFGFGGYYALNLSLKYPTIAKGVITIGGEYDIKKFITGYFDEEAYFNSPLDYLFGLTEKKIVSRLGKTKFILGTGSLDDSFGQNKYISQLLFEKEVNHKFDVYPFSLNTFEDCKLILSNNLHYLAK